MINKHKRQSMWCYACQRASIAPGDEYTVRGGVTICQDCETPPKENDKEKRDG